MRDRKEQIIKEAMKIVAEEGYGNLSMRAVARASGLKLGALQYHFPHWADLLRGMADYIMDQYSLGAMHWKLPRVLLLRIKIKNLGLSHFSQKGRVFGGSLSALALGIRNHRKRESLT